MDVGGDRLAAGQAILDCQFDGLAGVGHGLVVGVALTAELGQRRHGDNEPSFFGGLENDSEPARPRMPNRQAAALRPTDPVALTWAPIDFNLYASP